MAQAPSKAAGLANNHSFDLGALGYQDTRAILERSGIAPIGHKEIADLGALRLIALNFIGKVDQRGYPVVKDTDLEDICRMKAHGPLIALVHWARNTRPRPPLRNMPRPRRWRLAA